MGDFIVLPDGFQVEKHRNGPDGRKPVQCPVCATQFVLPKTENVTKFMTHWKSCSLLLPKPAVPMGQALSQLLISEVTEPSRTSNSGSATVSTLAHGPQFGIAEALCKGSPDQGSRARQLSSKKTWNTSTNRCTNHPMRCPLCKINLKGEQSTIRSYNFVLHL
jgi:hypothetical protein